MTDFIYLEPEYMKPLLYALVMLLKWLAQIKYEIPVRNNGIGKG